MLVDVDHIFDFWLDRGLSLSPAEFFDFCYRGTSHRFFAIFHGYEFVPVLLGLSTISGWESIGAGLTAGYILHLLADQLFNTHLSRWTYFFTYRLHHRFEWKKIVRNLSEP
jgi:hypothetical protein